jgi:hypothetical protein
MCQNVAEMAKGDRANLEHLLRSAWERQVRLEAASGTESEKMSHRPQISLRTDAVLGLCLAFAAIVLATLTMESGYSFWWKTLFVFAGSASVWFCVWYWEKFTKWSKIGKVFSSFVVSILFLGFMTPPLESQFNREFDVRLSFKDSPSLSPFRRLVIKYDISNFRNYLMSTGLRIPDVVLPPVTVVKAGEGEGFNIPTGLPLYRGTLTISDKDITNRSETTLVYADYMIGKLAEQSQIWRSGHTAANQTEPDDASIHNLLFASSIEMSLSQYFNAAYWNKNPKGQCGPFCQVFWEIRKQLGPSFADRLAGATVLVSFDSPQEDRDDAAVVQFCKKLKTADSVIESDKGNWHQIQNILKAGGWDTSKI